MANSPPTEKVIPYALLGMTAVTGLVDAVSFLSLGRVFTANMTGNIVLLAFATAHVPGLSIARSLTALLAFLVGATLGGRVMARQAPIHRFDLGHKRSSWRWLFCWLRRFAAPDTEAICSKILFNRLL
jgi:uncharacterized membrane protein YoaK (UPF0700 family)